MPQFVRHRRIVVALLAAATLSAISPAFAQSGASVPAPPYIRPHTPTLGPANAGD